MRGYYVYVYAFALVMLVIKESSFIESFLNIN